MSSIKRVNLDLYKEGLTTKNFITRQGENGQQVSIIISENGVLTNLTGYEVWLRGITPDNKFIVLPTTVQNNVATVTLTKNWNSAHGTFKNCYIQVIRTGQIITTQSLDWLVLPEASITNHDSAHYIDELQKIIDELERKSDEVLDDLYTKLSGITGDMTDIENEIIQINADIAQAIEDFKAGNFYTKQESDNRFLTPDTLPVATSSTLGVVKTTNDPSISDGLTVPTTLLFKPVFEDVRTLKQFMLDANNKFIIKDSPVQVTVTSPINFTGTTLQYKGKDLVTADTVRKASWLNTCNTVSGLATSLTGATMKTIDIYSEDNLVLTTSPDGDITITNDHRLRFNRDMMVRISLNTTVQSVTQGLWKDISLRHHNTSGAVVNTHRIARQRQHPSKDVLDWFPLNGSKLLQVTQGDYIALLVNGDITSGIIALFDISVNEIV